MPSTTVEYLILVTNQHAEYAQCFQELSTACI